MVRSYLGRLTGASTNDDVEQYLDLVARSTSPPGLAALRLKVDSRRLANESHAGTAWKTGRS